MHESTQLVQTLKALFSSQRLAILATEDEGSLMAISCLWRKRITEGSSLCNNRSTVNMRIYPGRRGQPW